MGYLDNVDEQSAFVLFNGSKILNLEELYLVLKSADESVFFHHVTPDRNDFANWIRGCVHADSIANLLSAVKDRQTYLKILGEEIDFIKNPKLRETAQFFQKDYNATAPVSVSSPASVSMPNPAPNTITPVVAPASNAAASASTPASTSTSDAVTPLSAANPVVTPVPDSVIASASVPATSVKPATLSVESVSNGLVMNLLEFELILRTLVEDINNEIFFWEV